MSIGHSTKFAHEDKFSRLTIAVSYLLLALGGLFGLLQLVSRTPGFPKLVDSSTYYLSVTAHGVLLAILWTAAFIMGLAVFVVTRDLGVNVSKGGLYTSLVLVVVGTAMAVLAILSGQATVLYTFYPPLYASPLFYLGLAVVLIGTWVFSAAVLHAVWKWVRANRGLEIPLGVYGVVTTIVIWLLATPPLAYEVLALLVPMSLVGAPVDVLEARLWFWYFGHPLVYFWVVPAVTIWYTLLPRVLGVDVYSKAVAKIAFLLFIFASVPVGLHHQFVDPGIHPIFKYLHAVFTFIVAVPSFLTGLNVLATLEVAGRARGGRGLLGWISALPWWRDPVFTGIALTLVLFGIGGFSGVVNAAFIMNYLTHNTLWVVGHFHLMVGTATTLTFMVASFVLVPLLFGRRLVSETAARLVPILWFIGMFVFSLSYHIAGIYGTPRRTFAEPYLENPAEVAGVHAVDMWAPLLQAGAIGGIIFWLGGAIFIATVFLTMFRGQRMAMDSGDVKISPEPGPATVLDKLSLFIILALIVIVVAYALPAAEIYGRGLSPAPPWTPTAQPVSIK